MRINVDSRRQARKRAVRPQRYNGLKTNGRPYIATDRRPLPRSFKQRVRLSIAAERRGWS